MTQIYEIATKITMINGASAVLALLGKEVLSLEGGIDRLNKALASTRTMLAVGGGLSIVAGSGLLMGLKAVADHGDKLLDQQDKLQRAGMKLNDVLKLQANYYNHIAKQVPTSTAADYLRTFNELRSVVGADRAADKTPWAMKLESLMANMTGKSAEGQGFKILRALEMKGITLSDPAMSDKLADIMMKNIIGSGGKLSADDFQAMAKTGGAAWVKASPQFIAGPLSNIASDMGGSRTGTALMTLYQLFSGATQIGKLQAAELERLGMIKPGMLVTNKGGDASGVKPGGIVGWEIASKDPSKWVQEILMPHMHKAYGNNAEAIEASLAKIGRNRNAIRMLTMLSDPGFQEQMQKDYALWQQAHSVGQSYDEALQRNPKMVKEAFHAQYESMMQAIGGPMMQAAIPVMKAVTEMFTTIGKYANANPEFIKQLATGLAAFGAFLVGGGGVALLAALGPTGWFILGFAALGAALATFPAKPVMDAISTGLQAIGDKLNSLLETLKSWGEAFGRWLASLRDNVLSIFGGGGSGSYADSAARMRGMFAPGGISRSGVGGGSLGFSPSGAWWTADKQNLAIERLKNEAGLSHTGAAALVSTWAGIEAPGGPGSSNNMGGGHWGIAQWGRARGGGGVAGMDFNSQLTKAIGELNSSERHAASLLKSNDAATAAHGAASFERGGYGAAAVMRAMSRNKVIHTGAPPKNDKQSSLLGNDVVFEVEGETLGRLVSKHVSRHHEHSRQAPYFNGQQMYAGPGLQYAVG